MRTIKINGDIIGNDYADMYDWFEWEYTSPKNVQEVLDQGGDIEVQVNSGGGSVFAGSEIYSALKAHKGNVKVQITSLAGSSASIIAMAGDTVEIAPTAQIMIHNASSGARGGVEEMDAAKRSLISVNEGIANAYEIKTGIAKETLLNMMAEETWLNADKAVELGFADKVMFTESNPFNIAASVFESRITDENIQKFNQMKNVSKNKELHTAQLNLLKLKENHNE